MFQRPLLFTGILAAAVAAPYVLFSDNLGGAAKGSLRTMFGGSDAPAAGNLAASTPATMPVPIEQAFRFDLSPQWVTLQWPRVTTVLGETGRMGLRVALVSGTQPDDVAGSLTYYFDDQHQAQRITFQGFTGDEKKLVALLTSRHGLQPAPTLDAGLYQTTDAAGKTSRLFVKHLPVVRATTPNTRVEVTVELYRPTASLEAAAQSATTKTQPVVHPKAAGTRLMQRLRSW